MKVVILFKVWINLKFPFFLIFASFRPPPCEIRIPHDMPWWGSAREPLNCIVLEANKILFHNSNIPPFHWTCFDHPTFQRRFHFWAFLSMLGHWFHLCKVPSIFGTASIFATLLPILIRRFYFCNFASNFATSFLLLGH